MAARVPRRSFASPFVVTLAVACTPATTNPPTGTAADPNVAQTPTTDPATPDPATTDPPKTDEEPARWAVSKKGSDCFTQRRIECSDPSRSCNPPAPQKYDCPKWDDGSPMGFDEGDTIEGVAGAEKCTLYFSGGSCPEGASCNPPPPRAVACPKV
jgi:hypothetical protein